jgi:hypothetical protein
MANFSQSLVAGPEGTLCPAVGYSKFTVNVPSTSGYSVQFWGDNSGSLLLATVAPGGVATFGAPGGFWYQAQGAGVSPFTVAGVSSPLYELAAAGTTVTTTSTETVSASATIPANLLTTGSVVRVRVQGIQTAVNGADTCRFQVRIGPTTLTGQGVLDSTAVAGGVSYIFVGEFSLTCRAVPSATSACVGAGIQNVLAASGAAMLNTYLGSTNFATNGALLVEATIKFSSANAGNSARVDLLEVTVL